MAGRGNPQAARASPSDDAAAAAIGSLLGETDVATSAEEIAWAVRKLLEEQAPLIAVFDDVQWGEETFLDLLEHVALLSSGAPILLLAMARPELTERRAEWPVMLRLEPLGAAEAEELIPQGISGGLRAEIARAAGGNPLFVEEMVAVAGDAGGEVVVPPTLQALLATRLDQLDPAERAVLERGAVEGEVFHRGSVQALTDEEGQVTPRLASLVRKGLIRPQKPQLAGEDGFRFRHLLIRDAAYAGLPKATRADLHQRFAAWLEDRGTDLVELEEILGYHLEQAWRYRDELGRMATASWRRRRDAVWPPPAAGPSEAGLRCRRRTCSVAPPRSCPRMRSTSRSNSASSCPRLARQWTRSGGAGALVVERAALPAIGWTSSARGSGGVTVLCRARRALRAARRTRRAGLAGVRGGWRRFGLNLAYRALGYVARRGQMDALARGVRTALVHARRVGLPTAERWLVRRRAVSTVRRPLSSCSPGRTRRPTSATRNPLLRAHRASAWRCSIVSARRGSCSRAACRARRRGGCGVTGLEASDREFLAGDPAAAVASATRRITE